LDRRRLHPSVRPPCRPTPIQAAAGQIAPGASTWGSADQPVLPGDGLPDRATPSGRTALPTGEGGQTLRSPGGLRRRLRLHLRPVAQCRADAGRPLANGLAGPPAGYVCENGTGETKSGHSSRRTSAAALRESFKPEVGGQKSAVRSQKSAVGYPDL